MLALWAALGAFVALLLIVSLPRLRDIASGQGGCATRSTYRPEVGNQPGYAVDADLEGLTQDLAPRLAHRWAGGWVDRDGGITVGISGTGPLPTEAKSLVDHPKIRVVTQRFSTTQLSLVHQRVVARLNDLLAPGVPPGSMTPWPYTSHTHTKDNIVEATVDERYRSRCEEIGPFSSKLGRPSGEGPPMTWGPPRIS
jgi:hypothetical protein